MNWRIINQPLGECYLSGGFAPKRKHIWPAVIMAAASVGSALYGAAKSNEANSNAQAQIAAEKAITQAERRRKMYENPLDRADVQNVIRSAKQQVDSIYKKAEGSAAVAGSTDASKQMAKDAGNKIIADTTANIVANDATRKDVVDAQYRQEEKALTQQQIGLKQQQGQNIANAASQISSALGQAAMSYAGTYMGAGSPGGTGVTASQGGTPKLQQMETTPSTSVPLTPEMQMAQAMQYYNRNYGYAAPNYGTWLSNFMGATKY